MKKILLGAALALSLMASPALARKDCEFGPSFDFMVRWAQELGNTAVPVSGDEAKRILKLVRAEATDTEDHVDEDSMSHVLVIYILGKDMITFSSYDKNGSICATTQMTTNGGTELLAKAYE